MKKLLSILVLVFYALALTAQTSLKGQVIDANTGEPLRYEEEDLRKDFRINNTYLGQIVNTSLYKAGKVLEFTTNLSYDNAIPFEMVFFFYNY